MSRLIYISTSIDLTSINHKAVYVCLASLSAPKDTVMNEELTIKQGEFITSYASLAKKLNESILNIKKYLTDLINDGHIGIVTICSLQYGDEIVHIQFIKREFFLYENEYDEMIKDDYEEHCIT